MTWKSGLLCHFSLFLYMWPISYISHCCDNVSDKNNLQRKALKLKDIIYQDGKSGQGAWGSRSRCIRGKAERECCCSPLSSSLFSVGSQPTGCGSPLLDLVCPPKSNLDSPSQAGKGLAYLCADSRSSEADNQC